jgi:hypothetical protein
MTDGLSCNVCYQDFDGKMYRPRVLVCGHTFCQSCIDRIGSPLIFITGLLINPQRHINMIRCPICAHDTEEESPEDVCSNYELENFVTTGNDLYLERCRVCYELYGDDREPELLNCGHTMCRACTIRIVRESDTERTWLCPTCSAVTWRPCEDWVVRNFALETIQSSRCAACDLRPCRTRCKHCEQALCYTCYDLEPHSTQSTCRKQISRLWCRNRNKLIVFTHKVYSLLKYFLYTVLKLLHVPLAWLWWITALIMGTVIWPMYSVLKLLYLALAWIWRITAFILGTIIWPILWVCQKLGMRSDSIICYVIMACVGLYALAFIVLLRSSPRTIKIGHIGRF